MRLTLASAFLAVPLVVGCDVRRDETQRLVAATAARVVALETKVNTIAAEAVQDREDLLSLRVSHTAALDSHGRRIRAFEREYPLGTGYVRK